MVTDLTRLAKVYLTLGLGILFCVYVYVTMIEVQSHRAFNAKWGHIEEVTHG